MRRAELVWQLAHLQATNLYLTIESIVRQLLGPKPNQAARQRLVASLDVLLTDRILKRYTCHDSERDRYLSAVRLNRDHPMVRRLAPHFASHYADDYGSRDIYPAVGWGEDRGRTTARF